jgi:hypothetical protein
MKEESPQFLNLQLEAANATTNRDRLCELTQVSNELARLVAKNLSTPPELLLKLADSSDATTRQNVAANPNTPADVLLKLGAEFPEQLLNNPIFSQLSLENLNLIERIPPSTLGSLLKCEAANQNTSSDRLAELASLTTALARIVAQNLSATPELLKKLGAMRDVKTRLYVTANPNTPAHVLLKLGRSFPEQLLRNPRFSLLLLEKPNLLPDFLDEMPLNTLQELLKLEGLPVRVLEKFAKHQDVWVRAAIAFNSNTPVTLLEELASDREAVRQSVAHNPNTPRSILEELAKDINWLVRQAVASNSNTPGSTLEELSWDNQWHIRVAVASNPNTPTQILENFRWDNDRGMRQALAQNPSTPAQILEQLACDNDLEIRREVAKNPNTPVSVLEQWVRDQDFAVCLFRRHPSFNR